ncbi:MAG: hypothetical protein AAB539_02165 [Patescibacteria group bacterium]
MRILFHPHARDRIRERGTTATEIIKTVETGERFSAKFGRIGFRKNIASSNMHSNKRYHAKQVEVYGVKTGNDFIVITVIVKHF